MVDIHCEKHSENQPTRIQTKEIPLWSERKTMRCLTSDLCQLDFIKNVILELAYL